MRSAIQIIDVRTEYFSCGGEEQEVKAEDAEFELEDAYIEEELLLSLNTFKLIEYPDFSHHGTTLCREVGSVD